MNLRACEQCEACKMLAGKRMSSLMTVRATLDTDPVLTMQVQSLMH